MHPKQQNYKKAYYILLDFVKELCFEFTIGHLRSFGGHMVVQKSNLIRLIDSAFQKNNKKTYYMP